MYIYPGPSYELLMTVEAGYPDSYFPIHLKSSTMDHQKITVG